MDYVSQLPCVRYYVFVKSRFKHTRAECESKTALLVVESDVRACGLPASFSVHLASSAVTPAGSVDKSRGDNVVRMWVQLKR